MQRRILTSTFVNICPEVQLKHSRSEKLCTLAGSQCTKKVIYFCHFLLLAMSHMGYIGTILLSFWTLQSEFRHVIFAQLTSYLYIEYLKESLFLTNSTMLLQIQYADFSIEYATSLLPYLSLLDYSTVESFEAFWSWNKTSQLSWYHQHHSTLSCKKKAKHMVRLCNVNLLTSMKLHQP